MLDIKLSDDELKKNTEEFFNIFHMNLLFSDTDTMNMEFKEAKLHENGKLLLATEKTIAHIDSFDTLRSRGKRTRFINKPVVETVYLDYDYLMELGNNEEFELKYLDSDQDGTNIKYQLSWANKNKFTKILIKSDVNWVPKKKDA